MFSTRETDKSTNLEINRIIPAYRTDRSSIVLTAIKN